MALLTAESDEAVKSILTTGITSSLPVLFLLLTATSIHLSLLRPSFPPLLRATPATTIFTVTVLPLVPVGFIATLLGSVLLLIYRTYLLMHGELPT